MISPDVLTDSTIQVPLDLKARIIESNHRAACAVPLIARDIVIGVLGVGDIAGRLFIPDDVALAQAFADHAALSLDNAHLYTELEAHLRQLETAQEHLLQASKLAAVGQLVTGVAHEINNPLATIMGHAEMLTRRLTDPAQAQRVAKISESALRAARIVHGLQTFIRPRAHEVMALDMRGLVGRVLALREAAMRFNHITVVQDLRPVPPVMGDAAQLEQVVLNLVLKAEQAVTGGPEPRIALGLGAHDAWMRLTVSDTGPGIPAEILSRIFEPFFTTKAPNQYAGLGLSTSHSIVQNHGGRLTAESPRGGGATFVLELPGHPGEVTEPSPDDTRLLTLRPGHVLVVEDEAHVAGMLHDLLKDFGLRVTVTADAEDAWLLLTTEGEAFDVITLDLRLAGLPGRALYERIEQALPSVVPRVIFITGEIADPEIELFLERTGRPVMRKPFPPRSLATTLAAVLG